MSRSDTAAVLGGLSEHTVDRHWVNSRDHLAASERLIDTTLHYNDPAGDPRDLTQGTYAHMPIRVATVTWQDDELLPVRHRRIDWFYLLDASDTVAVRYRSFVEESGQASTREVREEFESFEMAIVDEYHGRGDASLRELTARWKAATRARDALADESGVNTDVEIPSVAEVAVEDVTLRDVFRIVQSGLLTKREAASAFATDDESDVLDIMDLPDSGTPTNVEGRTLSEGWVDEFVRIEFSLLDLTTSIMAMYVMQSDSVIAQTAGDDIGDIIYRLWRGGFERGVESDYPVRLPTADALSVALALAVNQHLAADAPASTAFESVFDSVYQQLPPAVQHDVSEALDDMGLPEPEHDVDYDREDYES